LLPYYFFALLMLVGSDPDPVGAHIDVFYGRTNTLVNAVGEDDYLNQAFITGRAWQALFASNGTALRRWPVALSASKTRKDAGPPALSIRA
jgi:hypothetical protein